jgi:hypothetical protein
MKTSGLPRSSVEVGASRSRSASVIAASANTSDDAPGSAMPDVSAWQ